MKSLIRIPLVFFLAACNQTDPLKKEVNHTVDTITSNESTDTLLLKPEMIKKRESVDTNAKRKVDTALLMNTSMEILRIIKDRKYEKLAAFIHPQRYLRFSPYAHIDTVKDKILSVDEFLQLVKQNKKTNWNSSWDEKPEILTIAGYFKKFVYDVDFLNADLKSINQYHSQGTDLNNINEAYPLCDVVEFFFPGFEKKYEGLDFRALRLVYKMKNKKPFLVGIIHDQWTP